MGNFVSCSDNPLELANQELATTPVRIIRKPQRNPHFDRPGNPTCLICQEYQATCAANVCSELTMCNRCATQRTPARCPHCNDKYLTIKQVIPS